VIYNLPQTVNCRPILGGLITESNEIKFKRLPKRHFRTLTGGRDLSHIVTLVIKQNKTRNTSKRSPYGLYLKQITD
jgi:hypothetical protein